MVAVGDPSPAPAVGETLAALGTTVSWSEETSEATLASPRVSGIDVKNTTGVLPVPVSATTTAPSSVVQVAP